MSAFYIWNPSATSVKSNCIIDMVVTNGDVSDIAQDRKFMQGLLEEIGICETPIKWSVTPCRSKYYSEHLDEEDWRDIWQLVWKLQMTIDQPVCPEIKANSLIPWTPTDVTGDEWIKVVDEDKTTCFVVSDFNNDADLRKAKAAILSNPQVEKNCGRNIGLIFLLLATRRCWGNTSNSR